MFTNAITTCIEVHLSNVITEVSLKVEEDLHTDPHLVKGQRTRAMEYSSMKGTFT